MMYYSEFREFEVRLSGKSGKYLGISFHELAANLVQKQTTKVYEVMFSDM